jgi:hypothetical protein
LELSNKERTKKMVNVSAQTGGKHVARRSEVTALDLVKETMKALPDARRDVQFAHFRELLSEFPDYQHSVDWYYFSNLSDYIKGTRKSKSSPLDKAKRAAVGEAKAALTKSIKERIEVLLLTMPNGKLMRECTGKEMAAFGKGYQRIAATVGNKIVGSVLDEKAARSLLNPI